MSLGQGQRGPRTQTNHAVGVARAARAGNGQAAAQLGHLYLLGEGVPANNETALKFFRMAVDRDSPSGYSGMGLAYLHGYGAPRALCCSTSSS
jgi:uncharacterized protein